MVTDYDTRTRVSTEIRPTCKRADVTSIVPHPQHPFKCTEKRKFQSNAIRSRVQLDCCLFNCFFFFSLLLLLRAIYLDTSTRLVYTQRHVYTFAANQTNNTCIELSPASLSSASVVDRRISKPNDKPTIYPTFSKWLTLVILIYFVLFWQTIGKVGKLIRPAFLYRLVGRLETNFYEFEPNLSRVDFCLLFYY